MQRSDAVIIGGGIVGLATAFQLTRRKRPPRVVLLEKEPELARHQTGHNSGVLHSGIYYRPGSLKAHNCRDGRRAMIDFCRAEHIPHEVCGKVIVAVDDAELAALESIYRRGQANGVACRLIDRAELARLEPHATGVRAIHVADAGIVDFRRVCERLAARSRASGATLVTGARVVEIQQRHDEIVVATTAGPFAAKQLINCAGLYGDRVTRLGGYRPRAQIVPFRGEYYALRPSARALCRNLIYPVPDAKFPFLGVHFTRMIDGGVECGPNAVVALAREGYRWRDVNLRDAFEALTYGGFLKMSARYWRTGLGELWRSLSKQAFVRALQRLVPAVGAADLLPAPAGVRAQAVAQDGTLVDDFLIQEQGRVINVLNAPSPAATASLNIGRLIADRVQAP